MTNSTSIPEELPADMNNEGTVAPVSQHDINNGPLDVPESSGKPADPLSEFRRQQRDRETVNAKVIKWQRNGLEMQLEDGPKAFMPNDMIDRDPNRNIANYFGKTLPVRITSIKGSGPKAEITVSHRAVLEDEDRQQGRERIKSLNVGDIVSARIKSFTNDNVIVDLGPGIDAVIRPRDLSWERFDHPYEIVKRGDTVEAKILQVDKGRRRVQLGIRQLTPDPVLEKLSKFEAGQIVTGKVLKMSEYGAEIELENGIIGFLPISEISWSRINRVEDVLSIGETFELKVILADVDTAKITLSKKQLTENPQRKVESTFKMGTDHNGIIKEVNKGGVVVSLEHNTEGFVPRRELSHDRIERLEDTFKIGKPLEGLRVIEFDRRTGRVTLSLIAAERESQRNTLKDYRATSKASSFAIGDLQSLKEKLEKLERK